MSMTMEETHIETVVERETSDVPAEASHIVMVPPDENDENPQAYVLRARIEGFAVTAICGHTWFPTRDPKNYPLCTRCKDLYENGYGHEGEGLPDA